MLLEVRSTSIVQDERITLRDEGGRVRIIGVAPERMNNPEHRHSASHLRQHMALGDPMVVHDRETPEGPVALRIIDDDTPAD